MIIIAAAAKTATAITIQSQRSEDVFSAGALSAAVEDCCSPAFTSAEIASLSFFTRSSTSV